MFTVFILWLGTPLSIAVAMIVARRLNPRHAQRLVATLAGAAAILGWTALAWTVFGPTYDETTFSTTGTVSATTRSLLDVGLSPLSMVVIAVEVAGFGLLLLAALFRRPNARGSQWLMLLGIAPLLAIGSISFGLADVIPAIVVAELAVALAFLTPNERQAIG